MNPQKPKFLGVVVVACLLPGTLAASAQQKVQLLDCARVEITKCYHRVSREHSVGFKIDNKCDRALLYQYRTYHKREDKAYVLNGSVPLSKTEKKCALTENSDHSFLHFVLRKGEPMPAIRPRPAEEVRKIIVTINRPDIANSSATVRMIEHALDLSVVEDAVDLENFTNNAHRAFYLLQDLRNESIQLSQNIPLRNAEYYVMGYYAGLSRDPQLSFEIDFAGGYTLLKRAAKNIGIVEKWARSNPSLPATPPGGMEWAAAGLLHGRVLRDTWAGGSDAKLRRRKFPVD